MGRLLPAERRDGAGGAGGSALGAVLLSQSFDAAWIQEGALTTLTAEAPFEGLYQAPLLLRLTADSQPGSAVSPLMNTQGQEEGWELTLNGTPTSGVLCFAVSGTNYIWTSLQGPYAQVHLSADLGHVLYDEPGNLPDSAADHT